MKSERDKEKKSIPIRFIVILYTVWSCHASEAIKYCKQIIDYIRGLVSFGQVKGRQRLVFLEQVRRKKMLLCKWDYLSFSREREREWVREREEEREREKTKGIPICFIVILYTVWSCHAGEDIKHCTQIIGYRQRLVSFGLVSRKDRIGVSWK